MLQRDIIGAMRSILVQIIPIVSLCWLIAYQDLSLQLFLLATEGTHKGRNQLSTPWLYYRISIILRVPIIETLVSIAHRAYAFIDKILKKIVQIFDWLAKLVTNFYTDYPLGM